MHWHNCRGVERRNRRKEEKGKSRGKERKRAKKAAFHWNSCEEDIWPVSKGREGLERREV